MARRLGFGRWWVVACALWIGAAGCGDVGADAPSCGAGTERLGDACVPTDSPVVCGPGTELVDGECRSADGGAACGAGTELVDGVCVVSMPTVCGAGTERVGDECVPTDSSIVCGAGTELVDGACRIADGGVTCGAGTREEVGECVPDDGLACGAGTERVGEECVPTDSPIICGAGTELEGGNCVPVDGAARCGEGTVLDAASGSCIVELPLECGPGTVRENDACVPSSAPNVCGDGTIEIDGRCELVTPALRCGPGTIAEGDTCVVEQPTECGPGTERVSGRCYPVGYPVPAPGDRLSWFSSDGSLGMELDAETTLDLRTRGVVESVGVYLVTVADEYVDVTPWVDVSVSGTGGIAWTREGFSVAGEGSVVLRASLGELATGDLIVASTLTGEGVPSLVPSSASLQLEYELDLQPLRLMARYPNGVEFDVTDDVTWTSDLSRVALQRIGSELYVVGRAGGATVIAFEWRPPTGDPVTAQVEVVATPLLESPALVAPLTGALVVDPLSDARIYIPPGALLRETLIGVRAMDDGSVEFSPAGLEFVVPATGEIRLASRAEPMSPWDLQLYDSAASTWEPLGLAAAVGADGLTVRFDLTHFSRYQTSVPATDQLQTLCEAHAPAFHFGPTDSRPISVESFMARSSLRVRVPGVVPFTWRTVVEDDTPTVSDVLATSSIANATRALGLASEYREACAELGLDEGWAAACRTWAGDTATPTAYCRPVSFNAPTSVLDAGPRLMALQYWLLYDASGLPGGALSGRLFHEGDWEMVQVLVGPDEERVAVTASQHWYGETRFGAEVPLVDGRPHIAVAEYSHSSLFGDAPVAGSGQGNVGFVRRYLPTAITTDTGGTARVSTAALNVVLASGDVLAVMRWDGTWGANAAFAAPPRSPAHRHPASSAGPDPWAAPWGFAAEFYHPGEVALNAARDRLAIFPERTLVSERHFTPADRSVLSTGGGRLMRLSVLAQRCRPDENLLGTLWTLISPTLMLDLYLYGDHAALLAELPGEWCDGGEPADAACADACGFEGQRRCAGDGAQYCRRTGGGCLNWSVVSACAFGDECTAGYCISTSDDAGAVCEPREARCNDAQNLAITCSSDGSRWIAASCGVLPCSGGACFDPSAGCAMGEAPTAWYADDDGDGFGRMSGRLDACTRPPGHVVDGGDCDDYRPSAYPGAEEACDGRDTDCDGVVDNGCVSPPARFVRVEPGTFVMGSPMDELGRDDSDETQRTVTLTRAFLIQTTEVTQGQWKSLSGGVNPSCFQSTTGTSCSTSNANDEGPVEGVDWDSAVAFANALSVREGLDECYTLTGCTGTADGWTDGYFRCLGRIFAGLSCSGYRLPTDAEWEYAARAGTVTATYAGNLSSIFDDLTLPPIAWFGENSGERTQAVATRVPNLWGLYDMLGNVREWSHDGYATSASAIDPVVPVEVYYYRVCRGGSWTSGPMRARAANRDSFGARSEDDIGFRLVRSLP